MNKKSIISLALAGCMITSTVSPAWWSKPKPSKIQKTLWVLTRTFKNVRKYIKKFPKKHQIMAGLASTVVAGFAIGKGKEGLEWCWDKTAGRIFGNEESRKVEKLIKNLKPTEIPNIQLKDMRGNVHKSPIANIVTTILNENMFEAEFKKAGGVKFVLFEGPPGTGKSTLSYAITNELKNLETNVTFFDLKGGADLENPYVGMTEKSIAKLFEKIRAAARPSLLARIKHKLYGTPLENDNLTVLFLDEIDGLAPKRDDGSSNHNKSKLSILLKEIEDNNSANKDCNILIMACSNRTDLLDSAMKRSGRFTIVPVGNPKTPEERKEFLEGFIQDMEKKGETFSDESKDYTIDELSKDEHTKDFSPADLKEIIKNASIEKSNRICNPIRLEVQAGNLSCREAKKQISEISARTEVGKHLIEYAYHFVSYNKTRELAESRRNILPQSNNNIEKLLDQRRNRNQQQNSRTQNRSGFGEWGQVFNRRYEFPISGGHILANDDDDTNQINREDWTNAFLQRRNDIARANTQPHNPSEELIEINDPRQE